jgi:DNA-binding MarR family transcriptional regulator
MTKEILEQLFDSPIKVRLLKLFLRNPEQSLNLREIARRIRSDSSSCQRQIKKLESIKFINSKVKSGRKNYSVNRDFDFYKELRTLVLKSSPASKKKISIRLKSLGRIKLAILSGIFVNAENSRVDLLIVGDNIKKKKLSNFLRDLEAETGKEIDYVILSTEDFKYRYEMFDRFIRDVLEKPHEKLINKLKV